MENNYGILINKNAKLHRGWFSEMVKLLGVIAKYRTPLMSSNYTLHGEFKALKYSEPISVGVIFEEHLKQQTAKKLGWNAELQDQASVIHVPYDLPGLEVGCLFEIPSAFDNTKGRLFRVVEMSATMIYPASISCKIVPEY